MKKLLLILLCLPMIGFGQQTVFNLDKKFKNMQTINESELDADGTRFAEVDLWNRTSSLIATMKESVTYKGKPFTGAAVALKKGIEFKCFVFMHQRNSYTNGGDSCFLPETKLANFVWNKFLDKHVYGAEYYNTTSCNEEEAYQITYFNQGEPLYTALIWNCGYKLVVDWFEKGRGEILRYYNNGHLFERQTYLYNWEDRINYDEKWGNLAMREKWLSYRIFYDTRGRKIQKVEYDTDASASIQWGAATQPDEEVFKKSYNKYWRTFILAQSF